MNIYIPHTWLKEFLDTSLSPKEIQDLISLSGPSVERIEEREGEPVYDVEVTANRVDSMSIYGIARESYAILKESDHQVQLKELEVDVLDDNTLPPLDIKISNDPKLCHRIMGVKIADVKGGQSPDWLQKRLLQVGQRPLNNIIDITNYIMWETGHPIHAFDYDKLVEKNITVRTAKEGESFTTLDGKTHQCVGGEVVFDDGTGTIIDLPGIMGTQNTVVDENTSTVLLWLESIRSDLIRHASMTHAIRSQAAVLNEKNVDPHLGSIALKRAVKLFKDITGGSVASQVSDEFPNPTKVVPIALKVSQVEEYLGTPIAADKISSILTSLGFSVDQSDTSLTVHPPTQRAHDVTIPQDLIEEIARIYGYHRLDSQIMDTAIPDNPDKYDYHAELSIKQWLAGWGAIETYTYSMVSQAEADISGYKSSDHVTISNPLSDDLIYMRKSLLPSLISVYKNNPNNTAPLFELQNTYHPSPNADQLPEEKMTLGIVSNQSYDECRGLLDALTQKLYCTLTADPMSNPRGFDPHASASLKINDTKVGYIGRIIVEQKQYFACELDLYELLSHSSTHPTALHLPKHPPIIEDLTFKISDAPIGHLLKHISNADPLVEEVVLKDTYQQNITITITYRHSDRPLSDQELAPIRSQIVKSIEKHFDASLVGSV